MSANAVNGVTQSVFTWPNNLFILYASNLHRLPPTQSSISQHTEGKSAHEHSLMRECGVCFCLRPSCQVVRVLLLQGGADPSIGDRQGQTPLQIAQEEGHDECVQLIQVWQQ